MSVVSVEDRTRQQRERILNAARGCFANSGFHAASMSTIAETAGISPGLIYRYFENKSAIILAIIEQQLELSKTRIRELRATGDLSCQIVEYFNQREQCSENVMNMSLYLESSAEASRDPQIASALRKFDDTMLGEVADWLSRPQALGGYGLPRDIAPARAQMLLCLIDGLKLRCARESGIDCKQLKSALEEVVNSLVTAP